MPEETANRLTFRCIQSSQFGLAAWKKLTWISLLFSFSLMSQAQALLAVGLQPSINSAQSLATPVAWRQARSPDPRGGSNYEALLQTAEFDRSDMGLAGMMVRCRERRIETIFVLLEPLAPRTVARVKIAANGIEEDYPASLIPTGAGLEVPLDIERDLQGRWRQMPDLSVWITTPAAKITGVVSLQGLAKPLAGLSAACVTSRLESEPTQ